MTPQFPNPAMAEDVADFINLGLQQGSFLEAVLSNDLRGACRQADDFNRHLLFEITCWLWNYAPSPCWGSPEAYRSWCQQGGLEGLRARRAAEQAQQEVMA